MIIRIRIARRQAVDQRHEFIATDPRQQIATADVPAQPCRYLPKNLVPRFMPVGIVDSLETIQVTEDDRKTPAVPARLGDQLIQPLVEHAPVRQACQFVIIRMPQDFPFILFHLQRMYDRRFQGFR